MNLPNKTEIFGIPYEIVWVKTTEVDSGNRKALWGQIIYDQAQIRISNEITDRNKLLTLFEELLHGVLAEMEYPDLNENHKFITPFCNGMFTALEKAGIIKCP